VWAIRTLNKRALNETVAGLIKGEIEYVAPEIPADPFEQTEGDTAILKVYGTIVKGLNLPEDIAAFLGLYDLESLTDDLKEVAENADIANVIIDFASPGGTSTGLVEASQLIAQLATQRRVIGYTSDLCCSAAYWLASQCGELYCSPTSELGSVGVYCERLDFTGYNAQKGIDVNLVASSPRKLWFNPDTKPSAEELGYLQSEVNKTYNQFKSTVLAGRKIDPQYLEAQTFDGVEAVSVNFADGNFNTIDDLIAEKL